MELLNSKRVLYSASHVTTKYTAEEEKNFSTESGGALKKVALLRAFGLGRESLARIRDSITRSDPRMRSHLELLVEATERLATPGPHFATARVVSQIPDVAVAEFARIASDSAPENAKLNLLSDIYELQMKVFPYGRLYLERLEMYSIGVEKGELVFTVPMAPGESTTISHKEWSVSTRGYEEIVQDYFESYSERGVTEKIDTATSTENETRRSNSLNFGMTLSGGYGPVSLTTTLGLNTSVEDREALKSSIQRNREVTDRSSARVRQEHKVSMKIETKQGVDTTSFKTITNDSTDAVRIDYYKMMRKWRTELYRYGLRLTYDITIPTPGVRLWARYQKLDALDKQIRTPVQFGLKPDDIHPGNFRLEANRVRANVPDEPLFQIVEDHHGGTDFLDEAPADRTRYGQISFDVPQGYKLADANFTAHCAVWEGHPTAFTLLNISDSPPFPASGIVTSNLPELIDRTGHLAVQFEYRNVSQASIQIHATYFRLEATYEAWQRSVWQAIRAAAEARYQEEVGRLQGERDQLWRALVGKDTLSLRRLEREEMLRLIMLWLIGPGKPYTSAPAWVESTLDQMLKGEVAFFKGGPPTVPSPTFATVDDSEWFEALLFGDLVRFVQQAVEWENLLYVMYPYFWGSEADGRDKMLFEHPDPEHQNFLRAGYCRVIVTVRPGFEADFTRLVETGSLGGTYTSKYLTAAEEIANRARTNYAGIPPANPEKHARPQLFPQQRETWAIMEQVVDAIENHKVDTGAYPAGLDDLPAGLRTTDAWGNSLNYTRPGSGNDYDLNSFGSDGAEGGEGTAADISAAAGASLMATWFDYTPTSGIDIVVNTKPEVIA